MMDFLFRLFHPSCWFMNEPYSKSWDGFVLRAIASGDVENCNAYTAKVGGKTVWVGNFPYAYGTPYPYPGNVRPSARTVFLLAEALAVADTKGGAA